MILARLNQLESYLRLRLDGLSDGQYDDLAPNMNNDELAGNGNRPGINPRFEENGFNPFDLPQVRDMFSQPLNSHQLLIEEMAREPLQVGESLSLEFNDSSAIMQAFFDTVNIWYACVNPADWQTTYQIASSAHFREGPESCLVLLVLALGKAGSVDHSSTSHEPAGMQYFSTAWRMIPCLVINHSIIATQCVFLASAYLLYLTRPVEACTLLSSITVKLQLQLATHAVLTPEAKKLSTRVIWNAILLESDILAELALPQSPLISHFATLDLPSPFISPSNSNDDNFSATLPRDDPWYLTASIYLYRIRNRISETLYSTSTPSSLDALEPLVMDLDSSLSTWSSTYLDSSNSVAPAVQNLLGFRYHATRALIYRPVLHLTLSSFSSPSTPPTITASTMIPNGIVHTHPAAARSMLHSSLDSSMGALEHYADYNPTSFPFAWQGGLAVVRCAIAIVAARDEQPHSHSHPNAHHAPTSTSISSTIRSRSPNPNPNLEQHQPTLSSLLPATEHINAVLAAVARELATMTRGGGGENRSAPSPSPSRNRSPSLARAVAIMEEILAASLGRGGRRDRRDSFR